MYNKSSADFKARILKDKRSEFVNRCSDIVRDSRSFTDFSDKKEKSTKLSSSLGSLSTLIEEYKSRIMDFSLKTDLDLEDKSFIKSLPNFEKSSVKWESFKPKSEYKVDMKDKLRVRKLFEESRKQPRFVSRWKNADFKSLDRALLSNAFREYAAAKLDKAYISYGGNFDDKGAKSKDEKPHDTIFVCKDLDCYLKKYETDINKPIDLMLDEGLPESQMKLSSRESASSLDDCVIDTIDGFVIKAYKSLESLKFDFNMAGLAMKSFSSKPKRGRPRLHSLDKSKGVKNISREDYETVQKYRNKIAGKCVRFTEIEMERLVSGNSTFSTTAPRTITTRRSIGNMGDEERQPCKGKIYGRRNDGRWASHASVKYLQKKLTPSVSSTELDAGGTPQGSTSAPNTILSPEFDSHHGAGYQSDMHIVSVDLAEYAVTPLINGPTVAAKIADIPILSPTFSPMHASGRAWLRPPIPLSPVKHRQHSEPDPPLPACRASISCDKDHCRLGCICDSLVSRSAGREHCGQPDCMFECICNTNSVISSAITRLDFSDSRKNKQVGEIAGSSAKEMGKNKRVGEANSGGASKNGSGAKVSKKRKRSPICEGGVRKSREQLDMDCVSDSLGSSMTEAEGVAVRKSQRIKTKPAFINPDRFNSLIYYDTSEWLMDDVPRSLKRRKLTDPERPNSVVRPESSQSTDVAPVSSGACVKSETMSDTEDQSQDGQAVAEPPVRPYSPLCSRTSIYNVKNRYLMAPCKSKQENNVPPQSVNENVAALAEKLSMYRTILPAAPVKSNNSSGSQESTKVQTSLQSAGAKTVEAKSKSKPMPQVLLVDRNKSKSQQLLEITDDCRWADESEVILKAITEYVSHFDSYPTCCHFTVLNYSILIKPKLGQPKKIPSRYLHKDIQSKELQAIRVHISKIKDGVNTLQSASNEGSSSTVAGGSKEDCGSVAGGNSKEMASLRLKEALAQAAQNMGDSQQKKDSENIKFKGKNCANYLISGGKIKSFSPSVPAKTNSPARASVPAKSVAPAAPPNILSHKQSSSTASVASVQSNSVEQASYSSVAMASASIAAMASDSIAAMASASRAETGLVGCADMASFGNIAAALSSSVAKASVSSVVSASCSVTRASVISKTYPSSVSVASSITSKISPSSVSGFKHSGCSYKYFPSSLHSRLWPSDGDNSGVPSTDEEVEICDIKPEMPEDNLVEVVENCEIVDSTLMGLSSSDVSMEIERNFTGIKSQPECISIIDEDSVESSALDENFDETFGEQNGSMLFGDHGYALKDSSMECDALTSADNNIHDFNNDVSAKERKLTSTYVNNTGAAERELKFASSFMNTEDSAAEGKSDSLINTGAEKRKLISACSINTDAMKHFSTEVSATNRKPTSASLISVSAMKEKFVTPSVDIQGSTSEESLLDVYNSISCSTSNYSTAIETVSNESLFSGNLNPFRPDIRASESSESEIYTSRQKVENDFGGLDSRQSTSVEVLDDYEHSMDSFIDIRPTVSCAVDFSGSSAKPLPARGSLADIKAGLTAGARPRAAAAAADVVVVVDSDEDDVVMPRSANDNMLVDVKPFDLLRDNNYNKDENDDDDDDDDDDDVDIESIPEEENSRTSLASSSSSNSSISRNSYNHSSSRHSNKKREFIFTSLEEQQLLQAGRSLTERIRRLELLKDFEALHRSLRYAGVFIGANKVSKRKLLIQAIRTVKDLRSDYERLCSVLLKESQIRAELRNDLSALECSRSSMDMKPVKVVGLKSGGTLPGRKCLPVKPKVEPLTDVPDILSG